MKQNCKAEIYKRDTYRRTGRGRSGFEMHYSRCQCGRKRGPNGFCWQHQRDVDAGRNVRVVEWADYEGV